MPIYAQMLKNNHEVVLVGGSEVGLPVNDHELVYCIELDGNNTVSVGMIYNLEEKVFGENMVQGNTVELEPSPQEKIITLLERQQQSELDKDEIMIDQLITAEEIKLALENTNKFSGGGGVTN